MKRVQSLSQFGRSVAWLKQPWHATYVAVLVGIMIGYIGQHYHAAYTLPLPWPDEAHFIWQANGVSEHFSIFAPQLNADRAIFWMPPGYFVVLGIVIRLFGLSLDVARGFSMVLMLSAIGMLSLLIRRYSLPLVSLLLAVPFVLGAPFVAAGNIARMEGLLLLLLLIAFFFLQRGKILVGLCLLALTPLVHPNGLYFFLSGLVAGILMLPRPWIWRRPTMGETFLIAVVVISWAGYGMEAWLNWPDFLHDMKFQIERKAVRNIKDAVLMASSVPLFVVVLLGGVYCYLKKLPVLFLLAIAIPAWWVAAAGIEMWYRVFFVLSFYLLTVTFLVIAHNIARESVSRWKGIVVAVLVGSTAGVIIGWNVMTSSFGEPLVFPDAKPWYKMTAGGSSYITDSDLTALRGIVDRLAQQKNNPVVEFYPAGDAFFFTSPDLPRIQFSYPLFCTRQPDWYLVHVSERFTPAFNRYLSELTDRSQVKSADLPKCFVHSNGNAERWFLIPGGPGLGVPGSH
jgi:hypothetical protein